MAVYDPWTDHAGLRLGESELERSLALVGDHGWIARLTCRAFDAVSAPGARRVVPATIDSVDRLELARASTGWFTYADERDGRGNNLCRWAAANGHLPLLRALRAVGTPWDCWTCNHAARGGHADVLRWALANGCDSTAHASGFAARRGDFPMVRWLHEQGCDWCDWTTTEAARRGDMEMLTYARGNGCVMSDHAAYLAAHAGHVDVAAWVRANLDPA
jgi:hypothetical protein